MKSLLVKRIEIKKIEIEWIYVFILVEYARIKLPFV